VDEDVISEQPADHSLIPDVEREFDTAVGRYKYLRIHGVQYRVYYEETGQGIPMVLLAMLNALDPLPDPLPDELRTAHGLPSYDEAIRQLHQPDSREQWQVARRRLRFDEAFVLQTVLAQRRMFTRSLEATPRPGRPDGLLARFDEHSQHYLDVARFARNDLA